MNLYHLIYIDIYRNSIVPAYIHRYIYSLLYSHPIIFTLLSILTPYHPPSLSHSLPIILTLLSIPTLYCTHSLLHSLLMVFTRYHIYSTIDPHSQSTSLPIIFTLLSILSRTRTRWKKKWICTTRSFENSGVKLFVPQSFLILSTSRIKKSPDLLFWNHFKFLADSPITSWKEPDHILKRALSYSEKSLIIFWTDPSFTLKRDLLHPEKSPEKSPNTLWSNPLKGPCSFLKRVL